MDEERSLTTVGEDFCFSCKTQLKYRKFYKLQYVSFKVAKQNEKLIPCAVGTYRKDGMCSSKTLYEQITCGCLYLQQWSPFYHFLQR